MNYSFLIYIGMACALCISAVGSGFGAGMASLASVGGWKKCYANDKQDPFILVGFAGAPLTQIIYGFLLMNFISVSISYKKREIGILRAIGASKRDISRVFNAETIIVGFGAGIIGIMATILLCVPINAIVHSLTGIYSINAVLPASAAVILVLISMGLTVIAGLIPSKVAANKDPVVALRTE